MKRKPVIEISMVNEIISKIIALVIVSYALAYLYKDETGLLPDIKVCILISAAVVLTYAIAKYLLKRYMKKQRFEKYLSLTLSDIDALDEKKFKKYLKAVFEEKGYKVRSVKSSESMGADLILYKKGGFAGDKYRLPEKTIVQAKRYEANIGMEAIKQIIEAKDYYRADKCAVVTNRYFTKDAKRLAREKDVSLWDREFFFGVPKSV